MTEPNTTTTAPPEPENQAKTYSNPRLELTVHDWPYGRELRTTATFKIETHPRLGQRAARVTVDPRNGRINKPKASTYATQARIVDGSDGRTYIISSHKYSDSICVHRGDLQIIEEYIYPADPRYAGLLALFAL